MRFADWRQLDRWDVGLLLARAFDGFWILLLQMAWTRFLDEVTRVPFVVVACVLALMALAQAVYETMLANQIQDEWPLSGPMGSVVVTRLVAAGIITVTSALCFFLPWRGGWLVLAAAPLMIAGLSAVRAFSSMSFFLAIKRSTKERGKDVRALLFLLEYVVHNVAAMLAYYSYTGLRYLWDPSFELADLMGMGLAALAAVATAVVARTMDLHHSSVRKMLPKRRLRKQREERQFKEHFGRFVVYWIMMRGAQMALLHLETTLPKYLMMRLDQDVWFPVIQALNPLMILIFFPFVRVVAPSKLGPLWAILLGGVLLCTAYMWPAASETLWAVIVGVIHLTLGEAIVMPRARDYLAEILPDGKEGHYIGIMAIPTALVDQLGVWLMSAALIHDYDAHHAMWWWVVLGTAWTPLWALFLLGYQRWRLRQPAEEHYEQLMSTQIAPFR